MLREEITVTIWSIMSSKALSKGEKKSSIAYFFRGRHAYSRYHTISTVCGDSFNSD